jgi:lipopolysaccharide transport system permease protein
MSRVPAQETTPQPSIVPPGLPGPFRPLTCLWETPHITWQLTRQELLARYRGSILGLLWSFITPLVLLAMFTFVFSIIFEIRWPSRVGDRGEFAVVLFAGFIVFWLFSDCVGRAPTLIVQNVNFVKKVIFPLEILPWTVLIASLFHTAVAVIILLIFHLFVYGLPPLTIILLPVVLFPFVLMIMGWCWLLASLGVFFRDIGHAVNVLLTVFIYTAPIIYPADAVPETYRPLLYLNPLTFIVDEVRAVMLWGELPNWIGLAIYLAAGWLVAWLGFAWFMKTRKGFANVL